MTTKVGVYRKYHGPIPTGPDGTPLPKEAWLDKRPFRWAVRWFGMDGQRYSKSFKTRKLAERFAEKKQQEVRQGKADPPRSITLKDFAREHLALLKGSVARKTLKVHRSALEELAEAVGPHLLLRRIAVRDIERFKSRRLATGVSPATANKEICTLKRVFNLAIIRGYLHADGNPCVAIPMLKVAPKHPAYISPEDFRRFSQNLRTG